MRIYAIGDLHLSGNSEKPMDVFGAHWKDHKQKIETNWCETVDRDDIVLVPGDISWAMRIEDISDDLLWLSDLPGKKILLKGNHDYWWNSISKVRAALPKDIYAIQNDSVNIDGINFAGSRGWLLPGTQGFTEADNKIFMRELMRLRMSLNDADPSEITVAMLHFPPFDEKGRATEVAKILAEFGVKKAVYGHLHAKACKYAFEGEWDGVEYILCSADYIGFSPKLIF